MKPILRRTLAGAMYLGLLAWEWIQASESHLLVHLSHILTHMPRMLLRNPYLLLPALALASLAVLGAMALSGRVRHGWKTVCTLVCAARLLAPFLPRVRIPGYETGLLLPTVLGLAALCVSSFVLLSRRGLLEDPDPSRGGGYYEDLYRQGVISREEYEEMTRGR